MAMDVTFIQHLESNRVKIDDRQALDTPISVSLFDGKPRAYTIFNSLADILNKKAAVVYSAIGVVLSKSGALGILTEDLETVFFTVERTER